MPRIPTYRQGTLLPGGLLRGGSALFADSCWFTADAEPLGVRCPSFY